MKVELVAINAKYIHSNLAVYSLKAYANREQISISEYTINNLTDEILDDIYMKKPDILAFSCYIWNISVVREIVVEIKKMLPKVKIWLGGPEAYYNSRKLMESVKEIDIILCGEGEKTFKELCDLYIDENDENMENLATNQIEEKLSHIDGISYRTDKGNVVFTKAREAMDMSDIPFPYGDISEFENKIIYYESSRGCPFSCSYCLSSVEKSLRFRDVSLVKKELAFFVDNKVAQVKFVDRTFNCKKSHAMEIWKFILEHDNGITNFHFEIAADLIDDDELEILKQMRPGLVQLEIGVQSTNEATITEIHRTMKLDKLKYVVDKVKSFKNIHQHLDLIAGLPYEDLDTFKRSFNDVFAMRPEELQLGFLKVLSGSFMDANKQEYGIVHRDYQPYEVISTKWISYEDIHLLKGVEEMVEVYYNSGQFVCVLEWLLEKFDTPFEMFYEMSKFYIANFNRNEKHSRINRYIILGNFIEEKFGSTERGMANTLMTFDIYLRENAKSRPTFAKDLSCFREDIKTFAKSNNLKKNDHIEIISYEDYKNLPKHMISICEDKIETGEYVAAVFNYDYKSVITEQCKVTFMKIGD